MTKNINDVYASYQIWPPYTTPISSEPTKPSIEVSFNLEIPREIWARYHDNEEKLAEWAFKYLCNARLIYKGIQD